MFLDKPAEIINMQDYGTMNGAKVLDTATISITYDDLLLFINACGNEYLII